MSGYAKNADTTYESARLTRGERKISRIVLHVTPPPAQAALNNNALGNAGNGNTCATMHKDRMDIKVAECQQKIAACCLLCYPVWRASPAYGQGQGYREQYKTNCTMQDNFPKKKPRMGRASLYCNC